MLFKAGFYLEIGLETLIAKRKTSLLTRQVPEETRTRNQSEEILNRFQKETVQALEKLLQAIHQLFTTSDFDRGTVCGTTSVSLENRVVFRIATLLPTLSTGEYKQASASFLFKCCLMRAINMGNGSLYRDESGSVV